MRRILATLTLVMLFLLIQGNNRVVIAECATACGWTGTQCGVAVCTGYDKPTGDCWWSGSTCVCYKAVGCNASACWPSVCGPSTTMILDSPAGCCGGGSSSSSSSSSSSGGSSSSSSSSSGGSSSGGFDCSQCGDIA